MKLQKFTLTDQEFAHYLNESRITGDIATARENNISHMHGFVEGNEHLELMARRVGTNADPAFLEGQDSISAEKCIEALYEYAKIFGKAVREKKKILFGTGHPAGLFPIYCELARAAEDAGAEVLGIAEGDLFLDGDIRQILHVVMFEQYGNLQHTHFPGPMRLALNQLHERGMSGAAASLGIPTIGIADCNDPGLFVSAEQEQILVAVPMDDNVTPHLYQPVTEFILTEAGLL